MLIKGDGILSNINYIQSAIMQLEGGAFQKLFDQYLYKKYKFTNIQTLGVQAGTNKPTKGIPDSYVMTDDGKYILINYGSVNSRPKEKIKEDIIACFVRAEKEGRRSAECRDDGSHFWSRDGGIFAGKRLCRRNQRGSLAVLCPYRCRSVACEYTVGLQICARLHRTLQEKENVNALRFSG